LGIHQLMTSKRSKPQAQQANNALSGWFWLSALLLIILKLWLARGMTFNGIGYMTADDQLFIRQADAILNGDWLGSYNYLTLFKGPFYPIFIACISLLGLPLLTAQQILYAGACLAMCLALSPLIRRQYLLGILLAALLFNPMSVTNSVATRVLREGIYPALTLLSLAGAIGLLLRLEKTFRQRIAWILLLGVSLSAFWITREERIWILPALVILVCLGIYRIRKEKCCNWQQALVGLVLPAVMLGATILAVSALNLSHYGVFTITEYDNPIFLKAYGSLTRVKPDTWQPLIPVAAETRERIYAVSPAFARLEPWLEGDLGRLYARYGENVKSDKREMGGGWFHMAFREAVDLAGLTRDGHFPVDYYRQLAVEIEQACASGDLTCDPPRASFMAPWNPAYRSPLLANFWMAATYLAGFDDFNAGLKDCLGTEEQLEPFTRLTHERCWHTQASVLVDGWVVKPDESISLWVYDNGGNKILSPTAHRLSPDLVEHFARLNLDTREAATARFQLEADCPNGCVLVVKGEDGRIIEPVDLADPGSYINTPDENGLYYQFDRIDWRVGDEQLQSEQYRLNSIRSRILSKLGSLYQVVLPILSVFALMLYIGQTVEMIRKRKNILLWGLETACLSLIVVRLGMIAWLETSSINAIITTYLSPLYPILILCVFFPFYWIINTYLEARIKAATSTRG